MTKLVYFEIFNIFATDTKDMNHKEDLIIYDEELFAPLVNKNENRCFICINHANMMAIQPYITSSIYVKSTLFILVHNGNASVEINFKKQEIKSRQILLLSFGHFLKVTTVSSDFKFSSLYITKQFIDEMYSTDMLYKKMQYAIRTFKNPILDLDKLAYNTIIDRFKLIESINNDFMHIHRQEMILNALRIYFLDLRNIIDKKCNDMPEEKPSRDELYFETFLDLLFQHYKIEHQVEFYADKIHITAHYLTKIVKRLTGQTVSDFITQLVYREAEQLLKQPKLSIQQIASALNFSDQSAFGKFFKRNAGMSPKEYRNNDN